MALSVRSRTFAGGSAIDVAVPVAAYRSRPLDWWRDFERRFTYGYFEGMTDCYYSHTYKDDEIVPGAKYLHVSVRHDDRV